MELKFEGPTKPEVSFSASLVRQALERVLGSAQFQKSPGLSRLLRFLVEHHLTDEGDLKETFVGHALYGRALTYDPKADSVVRVNASRLRTRLIRYYEEHPEEKLLIELRPGSYIPLFRTISQSRAPALKLISKVLDLPESRIEAAPEVFPSVPEVSLPTVPPSPARDTNSTRRRGLVWVGVAALVVACVLFFVRTRRPQAAGSTENAWMLDRISSLGGEQ
jgi:hypothetical protein